MTKKYAGIDRFRMAAALMIAAIHTAPFAVISERTDFVVTYCLFRVGVPFFFMVTGFFVLSAYWDGDDKKLWRYLGKMTGIYLAATLLYLPLNLYAGKQIQGAGTFFRVLLFDGTFYHLWYLPAVILGCVITGLLYRILGFYGSGAAAFLLYGIGTLGDSYFGLISRWPVGKAFYDGIFTCSEYTRNGIFFAPLFLWMGAALRQREPGEAAENDRGKYVLPAGLLFSAAFMVLEGLYTYDSGWQKHNSMYFLLPAVMYFLFRLLLAAKGGVRGGYRDLSLWIYLIHPICIVLIRGAAKAAGLTKILVDHSLIHYLAVCLASLAGAYVICRILTVWKRAAKRGTKSDA
ncbi:MAG: acyltransferase [Lachnospiraceae bacterium]|nr:acyltransferase [Lachnospiraceae bacterium]